MVCYLFFALFSIVGSFLSRLPPEKGKLTLAMVTHNNFLCSINSLRAVTAVRERRKGKPKALAAAGRGKKNTGEIRKRRPRLEVARGRERRRLAIPWRVRRRWVTYFCYIIPVMLFGAIYNVLLRDGVPMICTRYCFFCCCIFRSWYT